MLLLQKEKGTRRGEEAGGGVWQKRIKIFPSYSKRNETRPGMDDCHHRRVGGKTIEAMQKPGSMGVLAGF